MGRHILPKSGDFSTVSAPSSEQQDSKFLSLPPEIRNRIYGFVFFSSVRKWPGKALDTRKNKAVSTAEPLVMVCKQLHAEALPVFYAETTFLFGHALSFKHWTRAIGQQKCQMLRDVLIMPESKFKYMHRWVLDDPEEKLREFAETGEKMLATIAHLSDIIKKGAVKARIPVAGGAGAKLMAWTSSPMKAVEERMESMLKRENRGLLMRAFLDIMFMGHDVLIMDQERLPVPNSAQEALTGEES
ncbi:hypothetical protein CLAFUW4_11776 [Fulvia fulva]|uniref:Uncharacterized protein n=1 Tax=Passalora fulva TaxID=5499 RepID=A0A9Q8PEL0_PASFU|nr:uncharacterized protein CLAFUR5_10820 [Fulvia fulva]KAK4618076.1 hypothetical protein CLAFUR4_11781 [Fulvia fulva]KAK4619210.1 hypothetical protein CLAFUR0_11794 [Fulvia fulva]UJO21001.1 hypothetical protein CLAFUR5_10820 [Fulvia fulva]WPV18034.1 hypothetical protein CLAFUW4_11776 [Fulvia fulva]WPV33170.1 hypothetical protein CLAFUW7_11783 [Fulvia fulva]